MSPTSKVKVRLDTPIRIRKLILESAIDATKLQKYLRNFKVIRRQKIEQVRMFKQKIKEIKEQFHEIEFESLKELPHLRIFQTKKPKAKKTKKIHEKSLITKKEIEKQKTPIKKDKLQAELDEIKTKLDTLDF